MHITGGGEPHVPQSIHFGGGNESLSLWLAWFNEMSLQGNRCSKVPEEDQRADLGSHRPASGNDCSVTRRSFRSTGKRCVGKSACSGQCRSRAAAKTL